MDFVGTLDIECADWDTFVVGATYDGAKVRIWRDLDEMIDWLLKRGGVWLAHAGGIYDTLAVIDRLLDRGTKFQADEHQARITRLVCGRLTIRDSYGLFPAPLDDLCGMLGRSVPALPWACTCGRDCGGFCRLSEAAIQGDPELEDYVSADVISLYDGMRELQKRAADDGIVLGGTLGMTAWKTAQATLGLPPAAYPSWDVWRYIRGADKPGRLAVIRPAAHGHGSHSDIRNAYPSALARAELPVGEFSQLGCREASAALDACLPGIYSVTVHVPEDLFMPPLPWRTGGRCVYPVGKFSGAWVLPELVAAFERGVQVVEVHSAMVWETTAPIFAELMAHWYSLRRAAGKDTPYGQWLSRMAKAVCGKLAEGPERHRVLAFPDEIKLCTRTKGCRNGCTGRCRRYTPIDVWHRVWSAPYWKLPDNAHVEWSAYLRAHTRIQLLTEAEKFGAADLVYMNTDSIWSLGRRLPSPMSDELGHWERKHGFTSWECRAPNVYRCTDEQGRVIVRAAGSHTGIADADWKRGGGVIDRGVNTFRRAAKRADSRIFKRKHRRWTLPEPPEDMMYGDRKLAPLDGVTYPLSADDWRERHATD